MKDHEILINRLDYSHEFSESPSPSLLCSVCGKIRGLHANDGFRPGHQVSIFAEVSERVRFHGPHPRFNRPQQVRIDKSEELLIASTARRRSEADRIRSEEARQLGLVVDTLRP